MTERTKEVFGNPELLRAKLGVYLKTPEKVELYAKAAEKFFEKGNKESIAFKATWSWWAFFGECWFFFFRKEYLVGAILFAIGVVISLFTHLITPNASNFVFLPMIFCAVFAKYKVIKNFEAALDRDSDEALELLGGKNAWAIWVPVGLIVLTFVLVVLMMDFSQLDNM